ncbi:MAG TPA: tripartite tricarboxylate transporter substrate-binding protein [Hyphomicrobiaceae bacterium]|nr:tripartite tricarboxylate transporter substrate-binding protein [Hyphomicrobiaceae bacterium]
MGERTFGPRRAGMVALGALALVLTPAGQTAWAIDNLEIMAPAAPGGGYDRTARAVLDTIEKEGLGKGGSVINVGGAGGAIGLAQFIRNKTGSGNAMIVGGFGMVASFATNKSPVTLLNVTPIARLTSEYLLVVVPKASPINSIKDLAAKLKANPAAVSWAGGSAGGTDHIFAGLIAQAAGVDPKQVNYIAFSGGGDSLAAIVGGQVTAGVGGFSELIEQVRAGNLRALGVSAEERLKGVDIPTLKEQGLDVTLSNWRGIAAPPGLSPEQTKAYLALIDTVVKSKTWQEHLAKNRWESAYLAGDAFRKYIETETARTTGVLEKLGLIK